MGKEQFYRTMYRMKKITAAGVWEKVDEGELTKAQALRMATCAHDGYARTIRPVHTQMDGDTVFALGTGRIDADVNPVQLCAAAAEVMARAVQNAIWAVQHA